MPGKIREFFQTTFVDFFDIEKRALVENNTYQNGFTVYDSSITGLKGANLLVTTYNETTKSCDITVLDLASRVVKKKWTISHKFIADNKNIFSSDIFFHLFHPIILRDGSIFSRLYFPDAEHKRLLLKINANGDQYSLINFYAHHSIEFDPDNNLWICGYTEKIKNSYFFDQQNFPNDAIVKINPNTGKLLFEKSVTEILIENGYDYLLTIGRHEKDALHLNDIQPALYSTKHWQIGDLLISIRNRNAVFLYRPSTNKILWMKIGPWSNQHDCDFVDSNKIMVFGNDIIRYSPRSSYLINGYNNVYMYDFDKNSVEKPYNTFFKSSDIKTTHEGRCDLLPNGDLFVEETKNGRLLIGDTAKVKMIYVERANKDMIRRFFWTRVVKDEEIFNLK